MAYTRRGKTADTLREDLHSVRAYEHDTDPRRVRTRRKARQPECSEDHQVVQQAGHPQSLSERVDEGQSGSGLLTRGDETTPERGLHRGGWDEHVRSQERCE